jgi:hypothetical protein
LLDAKDGWLKSTSSTSADLIDEAYLRTLSRLPTDVERSIARDHDLRSLLWALVNTKEFILNH